MKTAILLFLLVSCGLITFLIGGQYLKDNNLRLSAGVENVNTGNSSSVSFGDGGAKVDLEAVRVAKLEETQRLADRIRAIPSYDVGTFGGIKNCEVSVNNPFDEPIDVYIEADIIKANGGVFDRETVRFLGISAGSEMTKGVSGTARGTNVEVRVIGLKRGEVGCIYQDYEWKCDNVKN